VISCITEGIFVKTDSKQNSRNQESQSREWGSSASCWRGKPGKGCKQRWIQKTGNWAKRVNE